MSLFNASIDSLVHIKQTLVYNLSSFTFMFHTFSFNSYDGGQDVESKMRKKKKPSKGDES